MKALLHKNRLKAFTIWDLMIVLITVGLILFLLPRLAWHRQAKTGSRIRCISNLKQVGLAFRMWSGDNNYKFPMAVSTNAGGSLECVGTNEVFLHFLVISNELNSPKVLTCPTDPSRRQTSTFVTFSGKNLSYFVGLDAFETDPQMILSGDRNITTNGSPMSGILPLTAKSAASWTSELHPTSHGGNLGLADGSASQVDASGLRAQINRTTNLPERLAIP